MSNQRYYSINEYLKSRFGKKIIKLSIDGGFSCPNRDGTLSQDGCIFCSSKGSGDFSGDYSCGEVLEISQQYQFQISLLSNKWNMNDAGYIMYFQNFTNTYAPVSILRQKYEKALSLPGVVGLAIATRPDCLDKEIISLLSELNQRTFLWIELGLQSIHEETATLINRKYPLSTFRNALNLLNQANIKTVVHLILGLPYETKEQMIASIQYVSDLPIFGLKLHLLHIIQHTKLSQLYEKEPFYLFEKEEYISFVADVLEIIPKEITIHRLTGDAPKEILIAPLWSKNKRAILNGIHHELAMRKTCQGFRVHSS